MRRSVPSLPLSLYSMRPSTYMRVPLVTYCSTTSASLPKKVRRCQSVFSCCWPSRPDHWRFVARDRLATLVPPVVIRISGSLPTLPINWTLFRLRDIVLFLWVVMVHLAATSRRSKTAMRNLLGTRIVLGDPASGRMRRNSHERGVSLTMSFFRYDPSGQRSAMRPARVPRLGYGLTLPDSKSLRQVD